MGPGGRGRPLECGGGGIMPGGRICPASAWLRRTWMASSSLSSMRLCCQSHQ